MSNWVPRGDHALIYDYLPADCSAAARAPASMNFQGVQSSSIGLELT